MPFMGASPVADNSMQMPMTCLFKSCMTRYMLHVIEETAIIGRQGAIITPEFTSFAVLTFKDSIGKGSELGKAHLAAHVQLMFHPLLP